MFDKVFSPESSQQEVFVEVSQLVQSALDGYKVIPIAHCLYTRGDYMSWLGNKSFEVRVGLRLTCTNLFFL